MSAYRERPLHCAPELLEVEGGPASFCSCPPPPHSCLSHQPHFSAFRLPNGHVPVETAAPARVSVPKMGVRARIAEWPPRREQSRESLLENGQNGHSGGTGAQGLVPARSVAPRLARRRSKDVEFPDGVGGGSPGLSRTLVPLRQRSSSEVTLSEQDEAEGEARAGLYREYGSTSSIDVQGIPEQSFFDMLTQFHQERPDQRSTAPARLGELLRVEGVPMGPSPLPAAPQALTPTPRSDEGTLGRGENRVRKKSGGNESSLGTSSLFRKLRSAGRSEVEGGRAEPEDGRPADPGRPWQCPKSFAHYDVQSVLFDLHGAATQRAFVAQRRNTATGASAASAVSPVGSRMGTLGGQDAPFCSMEDLRCVEAVPPQGPDPGDSGGGAGGGPGPLLLSCPHFCNEMGGCTERNVSFLGSWAGPALSTRCSNSSVSVLEVPPEQQLARLDRLAHYSIEHVDLGARYYRQYFHSREHSNYFGTDEKLGPVAFSIRREKLDDSRDLKDQYQYRLILRTSELVTLRGSVLEDSVPSTSRHGTMRGLPLKEVLEYVAPELNVSCLRLALSTPKVTEQLLKLDEQGLSQKHKVGILLCRAGQSTEEEMYNNEEATSAFQAFLELLGEQVCLRGFTKYAAQLDTKTDSTGTHSLYTTYQDYEIMFHVSTMLPYMPNNPQQLLRKRHIGNDIVTIIFQEPGALPFTPQNIRSHFQHVFVIVRVHNPCSDGVCYSVAVTRMKDVPPFGPPIPGGVTFHDPEVFRSFLLAKVINAENAAHKSEKFHTMATRTRQEYLRDLAENCSSSTPLDSAGKLNNLISLASKKRERLRARDGAELGALGAVVWRVRAQDFSGGTPELSCMLAVSGEYVVLVDLATKEVVFNCFCADVIGWTPERLALKIYYGRGDHVAVRVPEGCAQDIREIVQRLKALTIGCETVDMTLRRNGLGQLGFHVRLDGTVAEVEEYGFAWQAGLRQGSRLVEICKVAAVTLSHEQMIDLLRTSVTVKVVIIPPYDEGGPRRGCTEEYEMKTVEQSPEPEPVSGFRPSHRSPAWRWDSPPSALSVPLSQRWAPAGTPQPMARTHKALVPIPYREPQHLPAKRPVSFPENHYNLPPAGSDRVLPYRNPSASFSAPSSGLSTAGLGSSGMGGPFVRYKPSPDRYGTPQRPLLGYEPHMNLDMASSGDSSSGFTSQASTMERAKPEPLWHVPVSSWGPPVGGGGAQKRAARQDPQGKDSPNRHSKGETQYSSHSSSNTLSSNASSSHSEERWFDGSVGGPGGLCEPAEPDLDPLCKGGSSDSGIDATTLYTPSPGTKAPKPGRSHPSSQKPLHGSATYSGLQELAGRTADGRRRESSPALPTSASQNKSYRTRTFPPPGVSADSFKPRAYTPQGYKTPTTDKPRPVRATTVTPTLGASQASSQQLSSSVPKSLYKSKHSSWQHRDDTPAASTLTSSADSSSKKQVDVNSKNVFGQPRLRASLRDLRSPRRSHKSTIEDDLKKLIIMDAPGEMPHRDESPRRTLQRTFSDESLCSGRRDASFASTPLFDAPATSSDLLFTCTLPTRRLAHGSGHAPLMPNKKVPLSASELSLTEVRDKVPPLRRLDPGLMPLPDTACGLEWSSLVNAAKAYEVQRAVSLFSLSEPQVGGPELRLVPSPVHFHTPQTPRTTPTLASDEMPGNFSDRLYHLEVMLKQLNNDLEKEKQDKVVLLAEMANLRENNQRLQEESLSASEQLRRFSEMFSVAHTAEKK